ncbi:MAG: type II toxin-antitoxin system RelE/ParE family toxin [Brevundimonas sp.]
MKVILSRQANLDLMARIDWLAALSPSASVKAEAAIRDHLKMLAVFPSVGRAINPDERKLVIPFGQDGFVAIYKIEADRVVIGRIFHSRQHRT